MSSYKKIKRSKCLNCKVEFISKQVKAVSCFKRVTIKNYVCPFCNIDQRALSKPIKRK